MERGPVPGVNFHELRMREAKCVSALLGTNYPQTNPNFEILRDNLRGR